MKKLLLTLAFLLACGGSSSSSNAEKTNAVYVRLVKIECINNPRCADTESILNAFTRAQAFHKKYIGRDIILSGFDSVTDPEPDKFFTVDEFNTNQRRFYSIKKHLDKLGIKANSKEREAILIIDKYLTNKNDGFYYVAGLSHICGLYDNKKWSVVYSSTGGDFDDELETALGSHIEHEFGGHWHGAYHTGKNANGKYDFMAENLWDYDMLTVEPSKHTLEDINRCMTRRNYVKTKYCKGNKKCLQRYHLRNDIVVKEVFGGFK